MSRNTKGMYVRKPRARPVRGCERDAIRTAHVPASAFESLGAWGLQSCHRRLVLSQCEKFDDDAGCGCRNNCCSLKVRRAIITSQSSLWCINVVAADLWCKNNIAANCEVKGKTKRASPPCPSFFPSLPIPIHSHPFPPRAVQNNSPNKTCTNEKTTEVCPRIMARRQSPSTSSIDHEAQAQPQKRQAHSIIPVCHFFQDFLSSYLPPATLPYNIIIPDFKFDCQKPTHHRSPRNGLTSHSSSHSSTSP